MISLHILYANAANKCSNCGQSDQLVIQDGFTYGGLLYKCTMKLFQLKVHIKMQIYILNILLQLLYHIYGYLQMLTLQWYGIYCSRLQDMVML